MISKFVKPMPADRKSPALENCVWSTGESAVWSSGPLLIRLPSSLPEGWYQKPHAACWEAYETLPKGAAGLPPSQPGIKETVGEQMIQMLADAQQKEPVVALDARLLMQVCKAARHLAPGGGGSPVPLVVKISGPRRTVAFSLHGEDEPFAILMPLNVGVGAEE